MSFIRGSSSLGDIECDIDFNLPVKRKLHSLQRRSMHNTNAVRVEIAFKLRHRWPPASSPMWANNKKENKGSTSKSLLTDVLNPEPLKMSNYSCHLFIMS